MAFEWILLLVAIAVLVWLSFIFRRWDYTMRSHLMASFAWLATAAIFNAIIGYRMGHVAASQWLDGYLVEQLFTMEDIFLYELVVEAFQVPTKVTRKAFFIVACVQVVFQTILFMGMASMIQSVKALPYFVGCWLILVTMLGPVIASLVLLNFSMEVDITLTKIETIENHYIALSSSVLAAFALPELYFVVRELFRRYYLMKYGVAGLMMFFGFMLLLRRWVVISDEVELATMMITLMTCMLLSKILGFGPRDKGGFEKSDTDESAQGDDAPECTVNKTDIDPGRQLFEGRSSG
ncbi:unnamed protein product [Polarella glacialis]|uniref:Uncharacterized protein n=1 Tax=Polarella glacialis TaxID=89957 RepID=A0A813EZ30_POLGL|nr:unnamed protein product [Polarella glacialis]CAE8735378.1 unnamed protein product [Polarella glacialis]